MCRTALTTYLEAGTCIYYRLFHVAYGRIEGWPGSLDTDANLPLEYVTKQLYQNISHP